MSTHNIIYTVYSRTHKLDQHVLFCTVYHSGYLHCTVYRGHTCIKYMQVDSVLDECGVAVPFNVTSQKETFFATKKKHNEKKKQKQMCAAFSMFPQCFDDVIIIGGDSQCRIFLSHKTLVMRSRCAYDFFFLFTQISDSVQELHLLCDTNLCFYTASTINTVYPFMQSQPHVRAVAGMVPYVCV